jgi:hypothetical protein
MCTSGTSTIRTVRAALLAPSLTVGLVLISACILEAIGCCNMSCSCCHVH